MLLQSYKVEYTVVKNTLLYGMIYTISNSFICGSNTLFILSQDGDALNVTTKVHFS